MHTNASQLSRIIVLAVYIQIVWAFNFSSTLVGYVWFGVQWLLAGFGLLYGLTRGGAGAAMLWLTVIWFGAARGYVLGNYTSFILLDLSYFSVLTVACITVTADSFERLLDGILNHISRALILAVPIIIATLAYLDFKPGTVENRYRLNLDKAGIDTFLLTGSIQVAMYFMPFFLRVKGRKKYALPIAVLCYAIYAMLTGSRTAMVTAFFSLAASLFLARNKVQALGMQKEFYIACALVTVVIVGTVAVLGSTGLKDTIELQNERFGLKEDYSSGRFDEALEAYNDLRPVEVIVGRGLGASKDNLGGVQTEHGVHMIHFGPLHLVFRGGVLLAILVYGSLVATAIRIWRTNLLRYELLLILLIFVGNDLTHQQWQSTFPLVAVSLVVIASKIGPPSALGTRHLRSSLPRNRSLAN